MTDNELIQIFRPLIVSGLTAQGFTGIAVKQAYQPTQQGANTQNTVYFFKVLDTLYGFPKRNSAYDLDNLVEKHTTIQQYQTVFQFNAWAIQDPTNLSSLTASDLVNAVANIIQLDSTREALNAQDVGILRITDVQNPYFTDDFERYEASPSFDVTFTHKMITVQTVPIVTRVEVNAASV